jgi:tartrate/fumarate subfamily iron-sulfur-dependent hydro-lyase alpha chain
MDPLIVGSKTVYDLMYNSMIMAVKILNTDVRSKFRELILSEKNPTARLNLELSLKNCTAYTEKEDPLLCPDTGAPTYYVRIGDNVRLEEGFSSLYRESRRAIRDATADFKLRPNMVHPVTRKNTGNNIGSYTPHLELRFDPGIDFLEVIAVPISGGSETSGTFYRMMSPMDGTKGIMKFILDCIKTSIYAGKTCPPNIIGIGIGGTADLCMKIAKQAAVLRPIGSRHPDESISELEKRLVALVNSSGIGPMGMGGSSGVLDVHIECAETHIAGLPVAYNAQCWLCRRKAARINADGSITYSDMPGWEYR